MSMVLRQHGEGAPTVVDDRDDRLAAALPLVTCCHRQGKAAINQTHMAFAHNRSEGASMGVLMQVARDVIPREDTYVDPEALVAIVPRPDDECCIMLKCGQQIIFPGSVDQAYHQLFARYTSTSPHLR